MKTIKFFFTLAALLVLTTSSCYFHDDGFFHNKCINGIGNDVEATFKLPPFDGVQASTNADVFITQGTAQKVVVYGQSNIIDLLDLYVSRGVLHMDFRNCVNRHNLEIHITMPEINYLGNSGSGDLYGENFFNVFEIVIRNSGSGEMNLGLVATEIDALISGSGDLEIEGDAAYLTLRNTGSGDFSAFKLTNEKANIQITGSGDAATRVNKVLDVKISGSGDVYYKGKPIINFNRTGSGKLIDAN